MKVNVRRSFLGNLWHRPSGLQNGQANAKGIHRTGPASMAGSNLIVIESSQTGRVLFSVNC